MQHHEAPAVVYAATAQVTHETIIIPLRSGQKNPMENQ